MDGPLLITILTPTLVFKIESCVKCRISGVGVYMKHVGEKGNSAVSRAGILSNFVNRSSNPPEEVTESATVEKKKKKVKSKA